MKFSKQQLKFFDRAKDVAMQSQFDVYHLGCVAVYKNKIIAASPNKFKTHPLQAKYDKYRDFNVHSEPKNMHSLHAEISCLSMIKHDIDYRDLELYIVRICRCGELGIAKPCKSCMTLIKSKGIRKIFYSTNDGFCYQELF